MDYKLFETNQEYHDKYKNLSTPCDSDYYDVHLKNYLENNEPNEFILTNYFTKLYSRTYDNETNIKYALEFVNYFKNIYISQDLMNEIFSNIHGPINWKTKEIDNGFNDLDLMRIFVNVIYKLLTTCAHNITIETFYSITKNINIDKFYLVAHKLMSKYKKKNTDDLVQDIKKIFEYLYQLDKEQEIQLNTLEYLIKFKFIDNYKPKNILEYRLLYKYETSIKKFKSFKNFIPDIYCLENACEIKSNTTVVKNLLKTIQPNSICLNNALKFTNNKVVELLLDLIDPTLEQVQNYSRLLNDDTLCILLNRL